jgi:hypothetical protein
MKRNAGVSAICYSCGELQIVRRMGVSQPTRQAMTITARVDWCVHIVVDDEAVRLGTVQAQTYQQAYRKAARQFGVSSERRNRLFVRPINRRSRLKRARSEPRPLKTTATPTTVRRTDVLGISSSQSDFFAGR